MGKCVLKPYLRWCCLAVLLGVLAACTNSEWFLSVLYNRAGNMIADEVFEYAEYTDEQEQQILAIIEEFHLWHRVTQLPQYADFLESVAARMRSGRHLSRGDVDHWYARVEALADQTGRCHPMLYGMDIMRGLSDEQIGQIADHMQDQYDRYMERSEKRTPEERLERWHRNRVRWLNRFDLDPDREERVALQAVLERMPNMREANFDIWQSWDKQLLELLEDRHSPDFDERMRAHILSLREITQEQYPQRLAQARSLWVEYLTGLLNARIESQDDRFANWADKMAGNLRAISGKVPEDAGLSGVSAYCPEYSRP